MLNLKADKTQIIVFGALSSQDIWEKVLYLWLSAYIYPSLNFTAAIFSIIY